MIHYLLLHLILNLQAPMTAIATVSCPPSCCPLLMMSQVVSPVSSKQCGISETITKKLEPAESRALQCFDWQRGPSSILSVTSLVFAMYRSMTIVESTDIFGRHGDLTLQEQFDLAYMSFKEFLKTAKIRCSQPPFTVKLVVKSSDEILMTGKAYNNRCIQLWLEHVMRTAAAMHTSDERIGHMSVCMTALARFMHLVEAAPRFLSQRQADEIHHEGMLFARMHVLPNAESARLGKPHFVIRPKLHAFAHLLLQVRKRCNFRYHHCFVDEDNMGWLRRTVLRAHGANQRGWALRMSKLRLWTLKHKIFKLRQSSNRRK
ncbi:unnamed protein product [Durusdinium trenchii]|uniref:Uncharacterized protein n=1 Tax=Durusdinium trenchii TaxID=1381693 RepID=A0ABP0PRV4_9DINO